MGAQATDAPRHQFFDLHPFDDIVIIGLDTKHKEGEHKLWCRRIFNPLDEGMVANVDKYKVRSPIKVKKIDAQMIEEDPLLEGLLGKYIAGWGRTRTRWARAATLRRRKRRAADPLVRVPAIIVERHVTFDELARESKLENAVRVQTNPIQEALDIQAMIDDGEPLEQIRIAYGLKTAGALAAKRRVLKLCDSAQSALISGKISTSAALRLVKYDHEEQESRLEDMFAALRDGDTVTEETVRRSTTSSEAAKGLSRATLRELAECKTLHPLLRRFARVVAGEREAKSCPTLSKSLRELGYLD